MIKTIPAQWGGGCSNCATPYPAGSFVFYDNEARKIVGCPACSAELAAQTASVPTGPISFHATVRAIRFMRDDGYGVITVTFEGTPPEGAPVGSGRPFAIKGRFGRAVALEDTLEFRGQWVQDPKYGWQLNATSALAVLAHTDQAIRAFLTKMPFVGPVTAAEIVKHFGGAERTVYVMQHEPHRLAEVRGITEDRAKAIAERFASAGALRETAIYLAGLELGESLTSMVLEKWEAEARARLEQDPYDLMEFPRVKFLRADEIARTKLGIAANDPRRARAAVLYLLEEEETGYDGGHTWTYASDLAGGSSHPNGGLPALALGGVGNIDGAPKKIVTIADLFGAPSTPK